MSSTYFIAFLFIDVFIAGIFITIAVRHAYEHFRPHKHDEPSSPLATAVKERLLHNSEVHYQKILDESIHSLENDLENNSKQINNLVTRFASVIVEDELSRYRVELSKLQQQAQTDMNGVKQAVSGHQAEIEAKIAAELQKEKQAMLSRIDTKLGDAVGSFLVEALQHNVDLGSQEAYLLQLLEEHKADFTAMVTEPDPFEESLATAPVNTMQAPVEPVATPIQSAQNSPVAPAVPPTVTQAQTVEVAHGNV